MQHLHAYMCHVNAHTAHEHTLLPSPGCPGLGSENPVFSASCPLSSPSLCDATISRSILQNKPPSLSKDPRSLSLLSPTHNGCLLLLVLPPPISQPKQKLNPANVFQWASIFIFHRQTHTSVFHSLPPVQSSLLNCIFVKWHES